MRSSHIILFVSLFAAQGFAQFDQSQLNLLTTGVGIRSLSMANNAVALSTDASALFWNPGGLAFSQVRELQGSLNGSYRSCDAVGNGDLKNMDKDVVQRIYLGHLTWEKAVPTTQGGFSYALGYLSPYSLDNVQSVSSADSSLHYRTTGRLPLISAGCGLQVAPGVGLGLSASLIVGGRTVTLNDTVSGAWYDYRIHQQFVGVDLRGGIALEPTADLRIGCMVAVPQLMSFNETWNWETSGYGNGSATNRGTVVGTASASLGAAYRLPFALLSLQGDARAPGPGAQPGRALAFWKFGGGLAAEVPIRSSGFCLRAGWSRHEYDQAPYQMRYSAVETAEPAIVDAQNVAADHGDNMLSGGFAWSRDSDLSIEAGYAFRFWSLTNSDAVSFEHQSHRAGLSLILRF